MRLKRFTRIFLGCFLYVVLNHILDLNRLVIYILFYYQLSEEQSRIIHFHLGF